MLNVIKTALFGCSLVVMGAAANAQTYPQTYPQRDQGYQERTYDNDQQNLNPGSVAHQVMADLNQTLNSGYLNRNQRAVLAQAAEDLRDFDRTFDQTGTFDRRELNEAIARIQSVANSGRLGEEQRAMLMDDANHLRNLRVNQVQGYRDDSYRNRDNGYRRNDQNSRYDQNNRGNGYYDQYGTWHPYR